LKVSRLFGGARLRSRTLKTLVVLGAVLALASITVGSASAAFPPPNGLHGWYTYSPVGGTVAFNFLHDPAHEFIGDVSCTQSGDTPDTEVTFLGMHTSNEAEVSVPGETGPGGTRVTCGGTLFKQNRLCLDVDSCIYFPGYYEAGPVGSETSFPLYIDTSGPLVTAVPHTSANANGWYNAPSSVTFSGSDPNSGIFLSLGLPFCASGYPFGPGVAGQSIGPPDKSHGEISGGCENGAGLLSAVTLVYKFDGTKPRLAPTVSPNPVTLNESATASPNAVDDLSGIDTASCGPVDTSTLGTHTVTCTATDKAGNTATAQASYDVVPAACNGLIATITGTAGDDVIEGTSGDDVIYDASGNNKITSRGGNDTICTGAGNDTIDSGDGADYVDAGGGDNEIWLRGEGDTLIAGAGNDTIDSGDGADTVDAGDGANKIFLRGENDTLIAGDGNDTIDSGEGADTVQAGGGNNEIWLRGGNDQVTAGAGNDTINGGAGTDTCTAGGGVNIVTLCEILL
jgi:RTX calcium-binding nonapeptide repeat (4 copies)